jgi:hypothetical protein
MLGAEALQVSLLLLELLLGSLLVSNSLFLFGELKIEILLHKTQLFPAFFIVFSKSGILERKLIDFLLHAFVLGYGHVSIAISFEDIGLSLKLVVFTI